MTTFKTGDRVWLIHPVDRYPHFVAPANATGTVVDTGDQNVFAVRLDAPVAGAEDWDNQVLWALDADEDPARDIALVGHDAPAWTPACWDDAPPAADRPPGTDRSWGEA